MTTIKKLLMASVVALVGVVGISSQAKADECAPVVVQPVRYDGYRVAGREGGWGRRDGGWARRERFEHGRRFDRVEHARGRYGRR